MIGKIILVALISCVTLSNGVPLSFSGRDLPYMDIGNGYADAYIQIYYAASLNDKFELVLTTDDIGSSRNPDWPDVIDIPYFFGSTQHFKIEMWDADSPDSDDYMGYVTFRYAEIVDDVDGILSRPLIDGEGSGGHLLIRRA